MTDRNEFDDAVFAEARGLATEIAPERDLWPGIEAAISEPVQARPRFMPYLAQAAAVLLLVGGSSGLTWLVMQGDGEDIVNGAPVASLTEFDAEFASFGSGFEDARDTQVVELDFALDRLSPEARADVEENLAIIRTAIDEINTALESEPDNVLLQEMLIDTYRKELDVMREVGGLTKDVMSRQDI
ncbi:MAG: hypothetical protein QNJ00_13075 [Woeseiaceae bacterium]|nr:hypothetical protein [Woeseiaceae bacterium]